MRCPLSIIGFTLWLLCFPTFVSAQASALDGESSASALPPAMPVPVGQIGDSVSVVPPLVWLLPAIILPLLLWGGLAWWRAWQTEPMRLRRKGVRELKRLQTAVGQSGRAPSSRELFQCLRAVAMSWGVTEATPASGQIRTAVLKLTGKSDEADLWHSLWRLTERGLYAPQGCSVTDWKSSLDACIGPLQPPERVHRFPTLRQHWLPSLSLLPFVFASVLLVPEQGYAQPKSDARSDWVGALQADGRDWAAHQNLARSLYDEGQSGPALPHSLAAFLLHASDDSRRLLNVNLDAIGTADPTLQGLFSEPSLSGIPGHFSPASWQRFAVLSAIVLALGLVIAIVGLYRSQRRYWLVPGTVIAVFGIAALVVCQLSWSSWGDLRYPDAAMLLQSVNLLPEPTDLVPQEESSPLQEGAIVRVNREFLGWIQIHQEGGNTSGWVRSASVMPLYGNTNVKDA